MCGGVQDGQEHKWLIDCDNFIHIDMLFASIHSYFGQPVLLSMLAGELSPAFQAEAFAFMAAQMAATQKGMQGTHVITLNDSPSSCPV